MKERVNWDELEESSKTVFSVWINQPELRWGKQAWEILEKAGLSVYSNEFGRYSVLFRFLVLGGIYLDFCCMAWEECIEKEYSEWSYDFDLDPFIIGQVYARLSECELDEELDQDEALHYLVEDKRSEVVSALLKGFGDVNGLYASLWKSRQFIEDDNDDDNGSELIIPGMMEGTDPFSPLTPARSNAYSWVDGGCCAISYW